jgi:hypothetical protein
LCIDGIACFTGNNDLLAHNIHYKNIDSLFVDLSAFFFFMYFVNMTLYSKIINNFAKYTLDVYLIHVNRLFIPLVWGGHVLFVDVNDSLFIAKAVLKILVIYMICTLFGFIKSKTIDLYYQRLAAKFCVHVRGLGALFLYRLEKW